LSAVLLLSSKSPIFSTLSPSIVPKNKNKPSRNKKEAIALSTAQAQKLHHSPFINTNNQIPYSQHPKMAPQNKALWITSVGSKAEIGDAPYTAPGPGSEILDLNINCGWLLVLSFSSCF